MKFIHDDQPQELYNSFNQWMFSSDKKLFGKIASKLEYCEKTKNIPGDVLELGVFKGSGMMAWLKALEIVSVNHKKVYGFDFFDMQKAVDAAKEDYQVMHHLFEGRDFDPQGYEEILDATLHKAGFNNFELHKGNVCHTLPNFLDKNPGFRVSIVNFDMDVEEPTLIAMEALWDRLVPGGYFLFDEYAFKEWTESNAVDEFCRKHGYQIETTRYFAPSAFLRKYT